MSQYPSVQTSFHLPAGAGALLISRHVSVAPFFDIFLLTRKVKAARPAG